MLNFNLVNIKMMKEKLRFSWREYLMIFEIIAVRIKYFYWYDNIWLDDCVKKFYTKNILKINLII